jgi:hypothetical protein
LPILKTVPLLNNAFHSGQLTLSRTALCITAGLRIFLLASVIGASHAATVTTSGFDLRLNGTQMVIKGMDYSPVPIGTAPGTSPYGDYFVPQYTNVWTPDIQSMRAAGVNAIKLYAGNPALNAGASNICKSSCQIFELLLAPARTLPIVKTIPLLSNAPRSSQPTLPQRAVRIATTVLGIFLVASVIVPSDAATVTTSGFDLFVNGNRMVIKGMDYSPVPIGAVPGDPPYGDYFVPEYSNVWTPDIQRMRAAGVNAIKLYAGNPGLNAGAPGTAGNWKDFLDACYNGGTNPIYVVMFSYIQGDVIAAGGAAYNQYVTDYQNMVRSTVTHPAILGYCVGNEIFGGDVTSNPTFWQNFGALLNAAKAAAPQGVTPFLMTATNGNYTPADAWPAIKQGEASGQLNSLDAWGINIYRGPVFGGPGNSAFVQ